jgi:hypothetical protein
MGTTDGVTDPTGMANETSGGERHPKDGPTPAGVTAPPRDEQGAPKPPGRTGDEDELTPEAAVAVDTEMADADSLDQPRSKPSRPAPNPERR